ncbi:hypothetical protein FVE85_3877 [Porphyridium purpureum]|uniref:Nucleolus and neural progenitor protein-like N-terminal domain-containing protein n=1 Tax=Porphyridium purpureum TaxID=35688 RepID=A0A5J4YST9_PORPP|nr:hypothetical protein FVE85_3877 [Porphyridium purpureum]|eukprot:POR2738..scf229_5
MATEQVEEAWVSSVHKRLASVRRAAGHGSREDERRLLERLMYRNKNQHRRAHYWCRIRMVRRRLAKLDACDVWNALRALDESVRVFREERPKERAKIGDGRARQRVKTQMKHRQQLSALLAAAQAFIKHATAYERQAQRWMAHDVRQAALAVETLVTAANFLPFAVAILAVLARLYCIESRVLSEIRELRCSLVEQVRDMTSPSSRHQFEDLGVHVAETCREASTPLPPSPSGLRSSPISLYDVFTSGGSLSADVTVDYARSDADTAQRRLQANGSSEKSRRGSQSLGSNEIDDIFGSQAL